MAIGDLLKTFKQNKVERGIYGELDRFLIKTKSSVDIGRPYEGKRRRDVHHPSALSSIDCLRNLVYGWLRADKTNDSVDGRIRRIFDTGHDFGYRMQGYFYEMGILLGSWHCVECKHEWLDMENPSPKVCPNCGAKLDIWYNLHYLEVPIVDKKRNIHGSADAVIKRPWGRQLIELKTIKNRGEYTSKYSVCFEDLQAPKSEHQFQANYYLHTAGSMYGRDSEDDFKHGLVIYGAKNDQKIKEFPITIIDEMVRQIETKIEIIDRAIETKTIPERPETYMKSKPPCKWCDYRDLCWSASGSSFEAIDKRGD